MKQLKPIRIKLRDVLINFMCSCSKTRKFMSVQKHADFKMSQLDIRELISNSIGFRDFVHCYLTHT